PISGHPLPDLRSPDRRTARAPFRPRALESLLEVCGRPLVVPQRVPHERVRPRRPPPGPPGHPGAPHPPGPPRPRGAPAPEHLVAVAVPTRRERGGGAVTAQVLLQ